ncbi:hypothetical protein PQR75_21820 [Paraburkholderia fungorum]|uniref:hypothetical protein n=1 Tax=Paraburkholderia fungorum TaxID=134537 RepID=UPI0038B6BBBE
MSIIPFHATEMGRAFSAIEISLEKLRCLVKKEPPSPEFRFQIEELAAESVVAVEVLSDCVRSCESRLQEMGMELRNALERTLSMQRQALQAHEHARTVQEVAEASMKEILSCIPGPNVIL